MNNANTFDILKFLESIPAEGVGYIEPALAPVAPKGPRFVVTLTPRTRGNAVDIRVNGRAEAVGYGPHDAIRQFRGVVATLRAEHKNADVVLPGGLKDENEIVRDTTTLYS
jgi:hypothetical protein